MKFICGDAADPGGGVFTARRFNQKHHVFLRLTSNDTEEAGEPGFKKAAVECECTALKYLRLGNGRATRAERTGIRREAQSAGFGRLRTGCTGAGLTGN